MGKEPDEKPFWIKFEMDKWEGGVDGLTPEAEYLFFRICRKIWSTGKPVLLEQLGPISRGINAPDVLLEELVRSKKVTVSNGLIKNPKAIAAHKSSKKMMIENKKRTKAATEARKKKALTPGSETENGEDRDDTRDDNENRTEQNSRKNSPSSSSPNYIQNSNSKNSGGKGNDDGNDQGRKPVLKASTLEEAHKIAPGYDIYYIEDRWHSSGFATGAKKPDAAFLGFLKKHIKENPL